MMRALVWIVEETWQATVAAAAAFLPAVTVVTLLHVRACDAQTVARGARHGLLGRSGRPLTGKPTPVITQGHIRDPGRRPGSRIRREFLASLMTTVDDTDRPVLRAAIRAGLCRAG
jgi:hypothetical protein